MMSLAERFPPGFALSSDTQRATGDDGTPAVLQA